MAAVQRTEGGICATAVATKCRVRAGTCEQRAAVVSGATGTYRSDPHRAETETEYGARRKGSGMENFSVIIRE